MGKIDKSVEKEIVCKSDNSENVEQEMRLSSKVEKTRTRQKSYVMDLRIHSPESLGSYGVKGLDTAPALIRVAKVKGLDVIAVTDFFSGDFIDKVKQASTNSNVTVLPGTIVRCCAGECKDVTICCLFPEDTNSAKVGEFLAAIGVPEFEFGNKSYLAKTPIEDILSTVEMFNGIAIPSRMDKTPHRLAAIPILVEKYGFRAFDLAYADSVSFFKSRWPKIKFKLLSFSSANALAQVGSRTAKVKLNNPGFEGIKELVARGS